MAVRYRDSLEQMSRECHASSGLVLNVHAEDVHLFIESPLEASIHKSRISDHGCDLRDCSGHENSHRGGVCKLVARLSVTIQEEERLLLQCSTTSSHDLLICRWSPINDVAR